MQIVGRGFCATTLAKYLKADAHFDAWHTTCKLYPDSCSAKRRGPRQRSGDGTARGEDKKLSVGRTQPNSFGGKEKDFRATATFLDLADATK
jgi:hypothetical protein